jgi:hypothetical protein
MKIEVAIIYTKKSGAINLMSEALASQKLGG